MQAKQDQTPTSSKRRASMPNTSLIDALIVYFALPILNILLLVVIVGVVMSWLISFNVINTHNQFVAAVYRITYAITEPLLRPIRSVLPSLGGMDFSPLLLILIIYFVRDFVLIRLMLIF